MSAPVKIVSHRAGFTLIELMIVVVIIGILAAIAIPKFFTFGEDAKEAEARTFLRQILVLEEQRRVSGGSYTDVFADIPAAAESVEGAKFHEFRLQLTPAGFNACSLPRAGHEYLASFSIDQDGTIAEIPDGSCAGNAP